MLPRHDQLRYVLSGPEEFSARPLAPFSPEVREFLAKLADRVVSDPRTREMPDAMAFAFFCRRANVEREAARYRDGEVRLGRGLAFHVTPTNMPVNFAFSWVFSMLAGNANVVRLPNRDFPQIAFLLEVVARVLAEGRFPEVAASNRFVAYGREDAITAAFSAIADVRIIWGGDATVAAIRKHPLPARGIDVAFADRYSFCVLGARAVSELPDPTLQRLAAGFYNDVYLMDQNACSSPHLVVWQGAPEDVVRGRARFWPALRAEADRRYELSPVGAVDKLTQARRDGIELEGVAAVERASPSVYQVGLEALAPGIDERRCRFGYFYEYSTEDLGEVCRIVNRRYQTLTYHGVDPQQVAALVTNHRLSGIDRVVPVGAALDISLRWDGFDLIRTLSRLCDVR